MIIEPKIGSCEPTLRFRKNKEGMWELKTLVTSSEWNEVNKRYRFDMNNDKLPRSTLY